MALAEGWIKQAGTIEDLARLTDLDPQALADTVSHFNVGADALVGGFVALAGCRSVDIAAGQLVLREAGGQLAFADGDGRLDRIDLSLDWRSRVFAAAHQDGLRRLCTLA